MIFLVSWSTVVQCLEMEYLAAEDAPGETDGHLSLKHLKVVGEQRADLSKDIMDIMQYVLML